MNRKLLIAIQSQHLYNIIIGKKTLEIRKVVPKWVLEAIDRGEVVEALWYCTKGKPYLYSICGRIGESDKMHDELTFLNGFIVAKSVIRKIEKYWHSTDDYDELLSTCELLNWELCEKSKLNNKQLENYLSEAKGYALRITDFEMIEPMGLSGVYTNKQQKHLSEPLDLKYGYMWKVSHSPQNMMSVWIKEEI